MENFASAFAGPPEKNNTYFLSPIQPNHLNLSNITEVINACRFSSRFLKIDPLSIGPFNRDLTRRDDVFLAFISLLLLLAIEGIVATVLLRTIKSGPDSSFAFSVKLLIELVRDLHLPRRVNTKRKLPTRLVLSAGALLTLVFGLEVLVLFLSEPHRVSVTNSQASLRLLYPIVPLYKGILFQTRASVDRPCTAISIRNTEYEIDQGSTRINACVTTNLTGQPLALFQKLTKDDGNVTITINSYTHRYGIEHTISVGELVAEYSARAYYSLSDNKPRLMSVEGFPSEHEANRVKHVHLQYVAALCSLYNLATKDSINLQFLNRLQIPFHDQEGPQVKLLSLRGQSISTNSTNYTSTVTGLLPRGSIALRVGQQVFKHSIGIQVTDSNKTDLFLDNGTVREESAAMWGENVRSLNWLSLFMALILTICALFILRFTLKPTTTSSIAAAFVKRSVGADSMRSPIELAKDEKTSFRVYPPSFQRYRFGAETGDQNLRLSGNYSVHSSEGRSQV